MALRTADNDPTLNPGQTHADKQFNGLKKAEENGTFDDSQKDNPDADSINDAESNPDSNWENKVSGEGQKSQKAGGKLSFLKKKGPLTTIILTLVGGGLGIGGLLSPGMLIVNLKEVMVNKFNAQLTSMDIRTTKILTKKVTGGVACSTLNVGCKYSTMSERQIDNFRKAGIEMEFDESKTFLGRKKPTKFIFDNEGISPSKFESTIQSNTKFRSAIKKAYNPLFAGFADKFWNKAAFTLRLSKKPVDIDGDTDAKKLQNIQESTKNPVDLDSIDESKIPTTDDYVTDKDGNPVYEDDKVTRKKYTALDIEAMKNAAKAGGEIAEEIAGQADTLSKSGAKAFTQAALASKGVVNTMKITGWMDNACLAYGTMRAVGFSAKVVRAAQLARYAMLFLTIADQIKAGGNPKPEDVSYLGNVLTASVESTVQTDNGPVTTQKTATDSFGYKYAAYGENGAMPDSATQFLAGGGLTGSLIGFTSTVNSILGGNPQKTCRILNNVAVSVVSGAIGIVGAIVSGGITVTWGVAVTTVVTIAALFLPALLKDIVAGVVVDATTVGDNAGDAITSGASTMMGEVAATGGNAPMTIDQAMAYNNLTKQVVAQYAEEYRLTHSPLDTSNKNTFIGNIMSGILPALSDMSSLSNTLASLTSFISRSFSSIIPMTKATDATDYTYCQDEDYQSLGLATDPYCNVSYGIPVEYLNADPVDVLSQVSGQINDDGTPLIGSDYANFVETCINRIDPIGYTGQDFQSPSGEECIVGGKGADSKNQYYYIYYIDQRVLSGIDGEDEALNLAMESGIDADISFYDGSNGFDSNIAESNDGTNIFSSISNFFNSIFSPQTKSTNSCTDFCGEIQLKI